MQRLGRLMVVLTLGFASTAPAQTVARSDLIGIWVLSQTWNSPKGTPTTGKEYLVLRDDSTWTRVGKLDGVETSRTTGRWAASNDSLWFGDVAVTDTIYYFGSEYMGGQIVPKWPSQKIDLSGGKLRIADYGTFAKWQEDHQGKTPFPPIWFQEFTRTTESEP